MGRARRRRAGAAEENLAAAQRFVPSQGAAAPRRPRPPRRRASDSGAQDDRHAHGTERTDGRPGIMSDPGRADEEDELDKSKAPLLEHLIELRRRLLWSVLALGISFAVCLY